MPDLTLTDVAFGLGLLTAFFGFYARFIRPGLVWRKDMEARVDTLQVDMESRVDKLQVDMESRVDTLQVDMESRVDKLQLRIEMHSETDTKLLSAVQSMGRDIGEIKTKIAVLEERSQRWGTSGA